MFLSVTKCLPIHQIKQTPMFAEQLPLIYINFATSCSWHISTLQPAALDKYQLCKQLLLTHINFATSCSWHLSTFQPAALDIYLLCNQLLLTYIYFATSCSRHISMLLDATTIPSWSTTFTNIVMISLSRARLGQHISIAALGLCPLAAIETVYSHVSIVT